MTNTMTNTTTTAIEAQHKDLLENILHNGDLAKLRVMRDDLSNRTMWESGDIICLMIDYADQYVQENVDNIPCEKHVYQEIMDVMWEFKRTSGIMYPFELKQ